MACIYYDKQNNKEYHSIQDLIADFYTSNSILKNAAIFSAYQIQDSTYNAVLKITSPGGDFMPVTTFITTPNSILFSRITGLTSNDRLAPEYILANRIFQYVSDRAGKLQSVDVTGLDYDSATFNDLKQRLPNVSEDKIIYLLHEIEEIIKQEKQTTELGTTLHKLISSKLLGKDVEYNKIFKSFFEAEENKPIFGQGSFNEWKSKIDHIVDSVTKMVLKFGKPITEFKIAARNNNVALSGQIDLIAVDTNGDAHIFEIKISKTEYKNWDSAKKLTLDWQLALYRQLLGQHINVDKTMLYTIPIYMPALGDPNTIHLENTVNRITENNSGLGSVGAITLAANKLLPRQVIVDYDPARELRLKNMLNTLMEENGENYEVKTNFEDSNVDTIMKHARERFEKTSKWQKWNNFDTIEDMPKGYMEAETEEEFRAKIEKYVGHVKLQLNRNVSILKDAMISAIKTGQAIKTNAFNPKKDLVANNLLREYLNDEWDVLNNIPETLPMGLIVLKNRNTGQVNVISLSINQFLAESHIKGKNYGDLEYLKTLLFINEFKNELLPTSNDKLGEIIIYNPESNDSYYVNTLGEFNSFKQRISQKGLKDSLKISENNIMGIEDIAMYNLNVGFKNYNGADKEFVNKLMAAMTNTNDDAQDLEKLLEIQKAFFDEYKGYKEKSLSPLLNFDDPREMLLALLQVAIISKSHMEVSGDFQNMSNFSFNFSDFKSLVAALYTHNQADYDKSGRKIQGMVQGLLWTTPDWVRSNDLRNINKIMSTSNTHIRERMLKVSEVLNKHTTKFYDAINFGELDRSWIGETQSKYEHMWLHSKDGKFSEEFKTKNPYKDDNENLLTPDEKVYLQNMLLQINMFKLSIPEAIIEKLDPTKLSSLETNDTIKKAIEDGSYFEMPLVRREEISKYKDAFQTPGEIWRDKIKPYATEINDFLDPRELLQADLDTIKLQKLGFYEMYDVYGGQTPEYKAKVLTKNGPSYFEWNLDTIAHRIAFNKIRKQTFDKKLPIINAFVWWIKLLGGKQNVDVSKQLDYVANQMNLAIYDEPIIDDEFKDYATTIAVVKKISTAAMLAFRPVLFIKEMTIGLMKGVSLAASQVYGKDQFGVGDLTAAYTKLMTIDNKFANEFNLIDKINAFYGFANMDVNSIAKKLQTDRKGLFRGLGRWMYSANTIPDYYNRLSLFLAKMIHDGSYEAHTLVDGKFTYDVTKDGRFSYYLAHRDKIKDSKGNYIPKTGDEKYNRQRQHYLLLQEQLNNEYLGEESRMTESDLIKKAYSAKERNSFKSFTDMAYGYYDKDSQSQSNNLWWGMTWLNFMQFWPGKMAMWFKKPVTEEDIQKSPDSSPMGRFEQETIEDENGNKVLQWRKPILDDNGDYTYNEDGKMMIEIVSENTGDPALKWTGTPYEGLAYSVFYTLQDLARLDFKAIGNNVERRNRVMFALSDAALMFIMFGIVKAILDAIIADEGTDGLSGEALKFAATANKKIYNEYNVFNSTLGAIRAEPAFLSWGKRMGTDISGVISGDKTVSQWLGRDVGALEFMREYKE